MVVKMMSKDDVILYVKKIPGLFADEPLECQEIGDGNMNVVFRVQQQDGSKSVIVKQALPYIRVIGESWPLTPDRLRVEYEALKLHNELCSAFVPEVYHFDEERSLMVMEDLGHYQIMRKALMKQTEHPHFAKQMGQFLAKTLFSTSDFALGSVEKKQKSAQFLNEAMVKTSEDVIFNYPYRNDDSNRFNPLIENIVLDVWANQPLKCEAAKLKLKFLTETQSLVHGDLHTGSIFVSEDGLKVFDHEFAFYGPMGFDIGTLFAHLLLNASSYEGRAEKSQEESAFQSYLLEVIEGIWQQFEREFRRLATENGIDKTLFVDGYIDHFLTSVLQDAVGFAGCKMMRRVIGVAHVEDIDSIENEQLRAKAEKTALTIAQKNILTRETIHKIEDFIDLVREQIK